ncbi:MAG TPA: hypothetical protein VIH76_17545 [Candidatus Acidoferrales bacterium]
MANWRQIQGRIRRAKSSADAPTKLAELYAKTRDAMVAFELAAVEEKAAHTDEAIRWYTTAIERFRRADWKKKTAEALERLGAPVPAGALTESAASKSAELNSTVEHETSLPDSAAGERDAPEETRKQTEETEAEISVSSAVREVEESSSGASAATSSADPAHKRRRRGRRGGRGRHRRGGSASSATPAVPAQRFVSTETPSPHEDEPPSAPNVGTLRARSGEESVRSAAYNAPPPRSSWPTEQSPTLPSERMAHGRGGEPAIASRLAHLESMLRRMLGSQLHKLDEADEAPAGPGVFLLSDSDLVTSYYIEACKTLRVGIGQLLRGVRGGRAQSGGSLRTRLAEHLEISESKVSDYLKKHCVVRWIQLDDEASHLAHFAIGVLRTPLNAE